MIRNALAVPLALALAACAANPPKQAPPVASSKAKAAHPPSTRSPYAPAQEDVSKRGGMVGDLYKPGEADSVPDDIPDVDRIPEPVPRDEPRSRYGNRSYKVLGKRYEDEPSGAELLCVKAGDGSLAIDGRVLPIKGAKPLPASD